MIRCGWCGKATEATERCAACDHIDPTRPYVQRGEPVPGLDRGDVNRRRLAEAMKTLGDDATIERIAEHLDVSPRTVRRWREMTT